MNFLLYHQLPKMKDFFVRFRLVRHRFRFFFLPFSINKISKFRSDVHGNYLLFCIIRIRLSSFGWIQTWFLSSFRFLFFKNLGGIYVHENYFVCFEIGLWFIGIILQDPDFKLHAQFFSVVQASDYINFFFFFQRFGWDLCSRKLFFVFRDRVMFYWNNFVVSRF